MVLFSLFPLFLRFAFHDRVNPVSVNLMHLLFVQCILQESNFLYEFCSRSTMLGLYVLKDVDL